MGCGQSGLSTAPRSALPPLPLSGDAAPMTTTFGYAWAITAIGPHHPIPHRSGRAASHAAAWTAALRAGRTALLHGELDTLSVTIGEHHCGAFYTPSRDKHGHINHEQLTAALTELHHTATAGDAADRICPVIDTVRIAPSRQRNNLC